jgi:uncharacterized membrane protein YccC
MIFAAKTTASGLIVLLIAFTFNLDQPQWALLTVFIVAQPRSGLVLAKSFYRIIGTVIGAAVALLFVALFAQERVLFLGALALWVGLCTFGSQFSRGFAAYAFVLCGYTVAIVGIPAALDVGNAFYIATARVTEISLGIIVTATVSSVVRPSSLSAELRQAVADAHPRLADFVLAVIGERDVVKLRTKLISQAILIENLRASAVFEDREIRDRNSALRRLDIALLNVVGAAELLGQRLELLGQVTERVAAGVSEALADATATVERLRAGTIGAGALRAGLLAATERSPLSRLDDFFAALVDYAEAHEAWVSGRVPALGGARLAHADDGVLALWTGVRATLAVVMVSTFWILADWPHGSTAAILAAVATARLATMGHAVSVSLAGTLIFGLATLPAFIIVEVLLPLASGFEMFALIVTPAIFCCSLLMANKKVEVQLLGFLSGLLFASVGLFQNRMVYDPVGLLNTAIAAVFAAGSAFLLWSIVAPDTPEAARRRFLRVAHRALAQVGAAHPQIGMAEFNMAMMEALEQLRAHLCPDRQEDAAVLEQGIALLGAGREVIRQRGEAGSAAVNQLALVADRLPRRFRDAA